MKKNNLTASALIFIGLTTFSQAYAAGVNWVDTSQPLPSRISLISELNTHPHLNISVDVADEESHQEFLDIHPYFGFIAVGERTLLLTKSPKTFQNFSQNPRTEEKAFVGSAPKPIEIKEFAGYLAYDMTPAKFMSPLIRKLNGLNAWDEGPNCWNLCQLSKGWARTTYTTNGSEFGLLMNSPFVKPVKTATMFGLEPSHGDLIVLRKKNFLNQSVEELHCALAIGFDLTFTKNGTDYTAPYRVMPVKDMINVYLPAYANTIEYFQLQSFDDVWREWGGKVTPELKSLVEAWMSFEFQNGKIFIPVKGQEWAENQEEIDRVDQLKYKLKKQINAISADRIKSYEQRNLNETEKVEQFFWRMLDEKVNSRYF